jgi:hypothetical protein
MDDGSDAEMLLRLISGNDRISIYDLSQLAGWTYGRMQQKVTRLIEAGQVYWIYGQENGRTVKLLSAHPFSPEEISPNKSTTSPECDTIRVAFRHLYGVFKELKDNGLDPTDGLISYCEKQGLEPKNLVDLLDRANAETSQPAIGGDS